MDSSGLKAIAEAATPGPWQIGVSAITAPYDARWQDDYVDAADHEEAMRKAADRGYYRNVLVRTALHHPEADLGKGEAK